MKYFRNPHLVVFLVAVVSVSIGLVFQQINQGGLLSGQDPIDPNTLTGEYDSAALTGTFNNRQVLVPGKDEVVAKGSNSSGVLGDTAGDKLITVDLASQRLMAYEGGQLKYSFLVSTGTYNRTPTGNFSIWSKFRYTKMSGGSKAQGNYYYLPNVPFVMFFSNSQVPMSSGYSLHGTYWHNNFGTPMSHGCINMKTEEAELIYNWAGPNLGDKGSVRASADNPGTTITVYGRPPGY